MPEILTKQQRRWFASVRDGIQRDTGKSVAEWVAVARTCPETAHRARLRWLKETHGLLQNRASVILDEAFPGAMRWSEPDALREALWIEPRSRAIFDSVQAIVLALPGIVAGQRKGYSAWSRNYQFAALRPLQGGKARLGLAVPPDTDAMLEAPRSEGWSERLRAACVLDAPPAGYSPVTALLHRAWQSS